MALKDYQLQINGTAGAFGWSTTIYTVDDAGAMEQAERAARDFVGVRWFMSVTVFEGDDERVVGKVRLDEPTVITTRGGK